LSVSVQERCATVRRTVPVGVPEPESTACKA
jgi:hypothetical protein